MRAIVYVVQVVIGSVLGVLLGRGAITAVDAAASPPCWRGCCAVMAVVAVGLAVLGGVAAIRGW